MTPPSPPTELAAATSGAHLHHADHGESHEHDTVLDSAGRLQIPADLRDAYGIRGRVKLVEEDGQISIVPADD